jgi:hypothetical protein
MAKNIEILVPEYTLLRDVRQGKLGTGEVIYRRGRGRIAYKGEVVDDGEVSAAILEALDDESHELHERVVKVLRRTSAKPRTADEKILNLPIEGYDDMDEDEVLGLLRAVRPEAAVQIKEYEKTRDQPRARILAYSVPHGLAPGDLNNGVGTGSVEDAEEDKPSGRSKLTTSLDPGVAANAYVEDSAPDEGAQPRRGRRARSDKDGE